MNEFELNLRLKQELESLAPNRLEELLSACGEREPVQSNIVSVSSRRRRMPRLIAAAAALVLLSGTFFGVKSAQRDVITMNVNPGVVFTVNGFDRVKAVSLNDDAAAILNAKDLEGMKLEKAVAAAAREFSVAEYLTDSSNGVLITVSDAGDRRAEKLGAKALGAVAEGTAFEPAVLVQHLESDDGVSALRSLVVSRASGITPQMAGTLGVQDLLYVVSSQSIDLPDADLSGTLNGWVCKNGDDAAAIALNHAGTAAGQSVIATLSVYNDQLAYQVLFMVDGNWLEYWISAKTGEILAAPQGSAGSAGETLPTHPGLNPAHTPNTPNEPGGPGIEPVPPVTPPVEPDDSSDPFDSFRDFIEFIDDLI